MTLETDMQGPSPDLPDAVPNLPPRRFVVWIWRQARRVVVFVFGSTVLLIGIAMIVLPGPAVVVIPLGLAILATEFVWARKWLDYAKRQMETLASQAAKFSRHDDQATPKD